MTLVADDDLTSISQPKTPTTALENDDNSDTINKQLVDLWSSQCHNLAKLQHETKDLQPILKWLENGILPTSDDEARRIILTAEHFRIVDRIFYHLHYPRIKRLHKIKPVIQQLCVPDVLREEILRAYHDNNAHIGRERLYETLKNKYHFPHIYVQKYVATCEECQKTKTSPHRRKAPCLPFLLSNRSHVYISTMYADCPRQQTATVTSWSSSTRLLYFVRHSPPKLLQQMKRRTYYTVK